MSGITNATKTVTELTALLSAVNPLVGAGISLGQALFKIFRQRGDTEVAARIRAAESERAIAAFDIASQRVIDKVEERLTELGQAAPVQPTREGRDD